jgi:transcriptional regulator with XRE-family HTH domain
MSDMSDNFLALATKPAAARVLALLARARSPLSIRDIARLAGVSVATVSRVLNDRPDVAPATRNAVLQVVERHRFQLNPNARSLSRGRLGLIAVTVPVVQGHYFAAMLGGITDALDDAGRRVLLYPARRDGLPGRDAYLTVLRQAFGTVGEGPGLELYFGATSGDVFGSADAGATWFEAATHLPPVYSVRATR